MIDKTAVNGELAPRVASTLVTPPQTHHSRPTRISLSGVDARLVSLKMRQRLRLQ